MTASESTLHARPAWLGDNFDMPEAREISAGVGHLVSALRDVNECFGSLFNRVLNHRAQYNVDPIVTVTPGEIWAAEFVLLYGDQPYLMYYYKGKRDPIIVTEQLIACLGADARKHGFVFSSFEHRPDAIFISLS